MKNKIRSLVRKLKRFGYSIKTKQANNRHDPVCGMEATSDYFLVQFQGKNYYFCSEYCKDQFEMRPDEYLD